MRGGSVKAAERIAPRGKECGTAPLGGAAGRAKARPTLVRLISVGVITIAVTAGRAIGGYAPRADSRWTTIASAAGKREARSRICVTLAESSEGSPVPLMNTLLPRLRIRKARTRSARTR